MTWLDGTVRDCGWLPGSDGLWVVGDRGAALFDFHTPSPG